MFTDNPVTPVRLEILIDTMRSCPRGLSRKEVYRMLQPESLNAELKSGSPAVVTLKAGIELELVCSITGTDDITLSAASRKLKDTRAAILEAFDVRVLSRTDVETYFALFYSYYLGLGTQVYERRSQNNEQWANQFNKDVFADAPQDNRFNGTKLTGLYRWFSYVGLGWHDPGGDFQANPYDRVTRALRAVFARKPKLEADEFMTKLAVVCPELDGGIIFLEANPHWDSVDKRCSLGLSHALIELHLDGFIRLNCPADSSGWNLGYAEPPRDESFRSDRFASIELLTK